jgi:flagellar motor switch protein FliM
MEKLLSQDEIDALLHGVEGGKVDTTPGQEDRSGITPYDFANQDRILRGKMPTLEIINDHFSRLFRNSLSTSLRRNVDVGSKGNQMIKFGEFIKTLPVPSSLHVFRMEPLRGHAILVLESKLVFTLLDLFFGGSGRTAFQIEGRDFTAIESKLVQKLVGMVLTDLEKAWNVVHPLTFQYVRSEINPQFLSIVPPSDLILTVTFGVELDPFTGMMTLCIPYPTIEPIKTKLYSGFQSDLMEVDHHWMLRFLERLKTSEVEVKVELGRTQVMVQDLLHLKVGDVLSLGKEVTELLRVQVQGVPKFLGKPGIYGTNRAIQIEGKISS